MGANGHGPDRRFPATVHTCSGRRRSRPAVRPATERANDQGTALGHIDQRRASSRPGSASGHERAYRNRLDKESTSNGSVFDYSEHVNVVSKLPSFADDNQRRQ